MRLSLKFFLRIVITFDQPEISALKENDSITLVDELLAISHIRLTVEEME